MTTGVLHQQALSVVDQLPPLIQSISDGIREFTPSPDDTREVRAEGRKEEEGRGRLRHAWGYSS